MPRLTPALLLGLLACGGDDVPQPALAGIYKVDVMNTDTVACSAGTPTTQAPAYVQLKQESLLGNPTYNFLTCQSADAASCGGFFGLPIYEVRPDGGMGYIASAAGSSSSCTLQYTEATFTVSAGQLRHELRTHRQSGLTGVSCTQQEAKQRGAAMTCVSSQNTLAARVSP